MLSTPKISTPRYKYRPKNVHAIIHKPMLISRTCKEERREGGAERSASEIFYGRERAMTDCSGMCTLRGWHKIHPGGALLITARIKKYAEAPQWQCIW